nr:putative late embryogenesis abundant protein, LEA-14 [Tanacetum cinerariifolium]
MIKYASNQSKSNRFRRQHSLINLKSGLVHLEANCNGSTLIKALWKPAVGGRYLLRMFKELRQSVTNNLGGAKPLVFVEDKEFLDKRKKLQDFETELTNVSQQSITFDQVVVDARADASGVATKMVTLNATIKFNLRNRGSFFWVHVSSTIVDLAYTDPTLATGS